MNEKNQNAMPSVKVQVYNSVPEPITLEKHHGNMKNHPYFLEENRRYQQDSTEPENSVSHGISYANGQTYNPLSNTAINALGNHQTERNYPKG